MEPGNAARGGADLHRIGVLYGGGSTADAGRGVSPRLLGARARRSHDPRLLRGTGAYVDDLQLPGMLHMAVWRSPQAHARLTAVDLEPALALDGVVDAFDISAF